MSRLKWKSKLSSTGIPKPMTRSEFGHFLI
jgi:hypothetical protein